MFSWFSHYLIAIDKRREDYKFAKKDPRYCRLVDRVYDEVFRVCCDHNPDQWLGEYRVPSDMDPLFCRRMVRTAIKKIKCGFPIETRLIRCAIGSKERYQLVVAVPHHKGILS